MTADEMWKQSKLTGNYDSWAFGDNADMLAELVKKGIKTATCSALILYSLENCEMPQKNKYSVILDSNNNAICIIITTKVYIKSFNKISQRHAYKEGEGNRSLEYWKNVHKEFFINELKNYDLSFNEKLELVCEEFKVVYK